MLMIYYRAFDERGVIMIFETHAHYDDEAFNEDREELIGQLKESGIGCVVNIGAGIASCKNTIDLMNRYDFFYGALGIHPGNAAELNEENFAWLAEQCKDAKCVAVGEIGLDYYWDNPEREVQIKWFRRQLRLAKELGLPVVIHSREAAQDTIEIMKEEHAEETGGVIHCYSYSKETAREFLNMGFYIGVGGVVTFKNGKKLKETVEAVPLERIVLETDCPYLTPEPNRGKRNSSLYLPYVVEQIAAIKGVTPEEVERVTYENALKLYSKIK